MTGPPVDPTIRRVVVTGAAGGIGSSFAAHAATELSLLLVDRDESGLGAVAAHGEVARCDLAEAERLTQLCAGADALLHLAADPRPDAPWAEVLHHNIDGTHTALAAARDAGVRRVVLASSIHAVGAHPRERQVRTDDPVAPTSLYGVSKVAGEALGAHFADAHGLDVLAVRIGAALPWPIARDPSGLWLIDIYAERHDLADLLLRCVQREHRGFAIVHGVSDNEPGRLDLTDTRARLGYAPTGGVHDQGPFLDARPPE